MTESWIQSLMAEPDQALEMLLTQGMLPGSLAAAEPADAAASLLFGYDADHEVCQRFDQACLRRFVQLRDTIFTAPPRAYRRALHRLHDLLAVTRRVQPRETCLALHRDRDGWEGFFANFVIDGGLDLRREFWRLLALTQDLAVQSDLPARSLLPTWLYLCRESGPYGQLHPSCFDVGQIGLRRLPLVPGIDANDEFVLQGLLIWAQHQHPDKKAFLREWRVIETDFPRSDEYWQDKITVALEAVAQNQNDKTKPPFPAASWLREELEIAPADPRRPAPRKNTKSSHPALPDRNERDALLSATSQPFTKIKGQIDALMARYQNYADRTGDAYFLVRSACNLGMRLLGRSPADEHAARGASASQLAVTALRYDPVHAPAWALWRDGLAAAGQMEAAESVGWEALRRFPENEQWRNQLASLLADRLGRPAEAETLLREAIQRFPDNAVAHTQLATVLADRLNRPAEAETLLREAIQRFPDDAVARTQLATVLADRLDRPAEAETLLRETIQRFPDDAVARMQLAMVLADRLNRPAEAETLLREAIQRFPDNAVARNQLATVLTDYGQRWDEAEAVLRQAKRDGVASKYTETLLVKAQQRRRLHGKPKSPPPPREPYKITPEVDQQVRKIQASADARRWLFWHQARIIPADAVAPAGVDAYSRFARQIAEQTTPPTETSFALAFEAALRSADPSALKAMIAQARPMDQIVLEAAIAISEGRIVEFPKRPPSQPVPENWAKTEQRLAKLTHNPAMQKCVLIELAGSQLRQAA